MASSTVSVEELLQACETALDTAERNVRIARALAEGCRSSVHPPDDIVEAYLACLERDEEEIRRLVEQVSGFRERCAE